MPKPSKAKKPHTESVLDIFVGPLTDKGRCNVALLVRDVICEGGPTAAGQVQSAIELFKSDHRFDLNDSGLETTVALVGDQSAGEPEDLTAEAQATVTPSGRTDIPTPFEQDAKGEQFPDGTTFVVSPPATGEAAPIPTIGEQLDKQDAAVSDEVTGERIEVVATLRQDPVEFQRMQDAERAKADKEVNEKRIASGIEAMESAILHVSADLKDKKDRLKVLRSELMASILGHTQTSLDAEDHDEIDPDDTPVGKAISGQAPMIVEPSVTGMYRQQGAEMAAQGKTELDCPYVRETNARGVSMWFDGFREAKREDHSEREAIVQALTREQLQDACLPCNGILLPGENTPKVATVIWDKRPHLVLDMLADGEGPTAGQERWHLLPLFKRDEWSAGDDCPALTYGDPIADTDANPERRETRLKGGVNCARLVKAGRSKLVVGPLQMLTVAIVKVDQIAAAEAAGEQPPH